MTEEEPQHPLDKGERMTAGNADYVKPRPTVEQFDTALDVLLWLHTHTSDGADRDRISFVRFLLDEEAYGP